MRPLSYSFTTIEDPPRVKVGAKAHALILLTQKNFRVPDGLVLTIDFFEPWLQEITSTQEWTEAKENPQKEKCDRLKIRAGALAFTIEQQDLINEALAILGEEGLFAVRSSSPEEDQFDNSFAGMYKTFLGVKSGDLGNRIRQVFISLFDYRVMSYKSQVGISHKKLGMAVIVQVQLNSEISGVGFSLNPQNNAYDEAVINASFGLGEAIVSGLVTPDIYVVEKFKNRILEKKVNYKEKGIWLHAEGGLDQGPCKNPKAQALSDERIVGVAELIGRCESHYGVPVDIEWAYEKNELYLLQVRPITTHIPIFPEMMTEPGERKKLYVDLLNVSQGFAEPLSVLGLDIWAKVMGMIGGQGIMPSGEGGYLLNLHGRQYFHVSNMLKGMGNRLGIVTVGNHDLVIKEQKEKIIREYKTLYKTKEMRQAKWAMVKVAFTMLPMMIGMLLNPKKQEILYTKLSEVFMDQVKHLEVVQGFGQVVENGFEHLQIVMKHSATYAPGELAMSRIKRLFKGKGLEDEIAAIQMMITSNPTVAMGKSQVALACQPELQETKDGKEFEDRILSKTYSKDFLEKVEKHASLYGDRGFKEIDIATPRLRNQMKDLYEQLSRIHIDDNQLIHAEKRKMKAYEGLRNEAKKIGKLRKFDKNAEVYERLFGFRETPKYMVAILIGRLHDLAMEVGEDLVRQGRLTSADEIFDLHLDEIEKVEHDFDFSLKDAREKNLTPYRRVAHIKKWPTNIDSRGKILFLKRKSTTDGLIGEAISRGVVRGRAKVLHSPYEKSIEAGEILVTHATEPAWTPIFINAAGVVLEIGGILQHGAIIAREYGIPCVSGIRDACQMIQDGDLIEVDGTQGVVRIIKE
ncbi:phosphoenolpyruvate synthase [Gottschalkiaceae bacterium SANA]|nr:phosphoenolpyruvate synthase [Gottschalkiaceae bacterium SANA]